MNPPSLRRVIGTPGAVLLGLGSILGTGIFVSVGLAAGLAQEHTLVAVVLAAVLATCNGLSSAALAASHPVSGGTYAYGYRYLTPALGFVAGWLFLLAKSASAATAALGLADYALSGIGLPGSGRVGLAMAVVTLLTALTAGGIQRSARANTVIVAVTLVALGSFVVGGVLSGVEAPSTAPRGAGAGGLLEATALMFVAYTGYGRVATLGEEVRDPSRTIPRAIVFTLGASLVIYVAVTATALRTVGASALSAAVGQADAPLAVAARHVGPPWLSSLVAVGALTAMTSVILNLLLGLSRVLLAMGRTGDMPGAVSVVAEVGATTTPRRAVLVMGGVVAGLTLIGSVKATWTFSALTVLVYYALTNLAALRLPPEQRRYPRVVPIFGLLSCLSLALFIEGRVWLWGSGLMVIGLLWRVSWRRLRGDRHGA